MQAVREKIRTESEKQEITPETEKGFNLLLEETSKHYYDFGRQINWKEFQGHWNGAHFGQKKGMLEARELWFKMKQEGESFRNFFANKIRKDLDSQGDIYELYKYLITYPSLGGDDSKFFAEVLDHKAVWSNPDGSSMHTLLGYLSSYKTQESADAVIRYIEHAVSPEYKRKDLLEGDLDSATGTLSNILGKDKASSILEELAEEDTTLNGWFEKNKLAIKAGTAGYILEKNLQSEEFDLEKEKARLIKLQEEVEELEKNPPPEPGPMLSSYWAESSFDDDLWDSGNEDDYDADEVYDPGINYDKKEESVGFQLTSSAKDWESGKLLNFYGRFKPRIENPEEITKENYPNSTLAVAREAKGSNPESYLGILNGVIERKKGPEGEEISESIGTTAEAYKVVAIAFARGLSVGVLENRKDDAITEISEIKDLIGRSAEKFDNPTDIAFLLSLVDQLGQLQAHLTELKERSMDTDLPESANSFLIFHPSLKRVREVSDFSQLLAEKIKWFLANDLAHNISNIELKTEKTSAGDEEIITPIKGPSFGRLKDIVSEYENGIRLYRTVEEQDVPKYWEAKESLEKDFDSKRNVVFGRDGRYFFTALKSAGFGQKRARQKYVVVTSPMTLSYSGVEKSRVAEYLSQNGVTLDFNFIDTGFAGSIPEFAIKCLASAADTELSMQEVNDRIKLLSSSNAGRVQLTRGARHSSSDFVHIIEGRPKSIERPETLIVDEKGRVKPEVEPKSISSQLRAWVVEHASFRNFAPKLNMEHPPIELNISQATLEKLKQNGFLPEQTADGKLVGVEKEIKESSGVLEQKEENAKKPTKTEQNENRSTKFSSFIDRHLEDIAGENKAEILKDAMRLHEVSRDIIGPVIKDFASWCLEKVKPGQKVLFLARDGLSPWIAARLLIRQGKFPDIKEDQLEYAQLSRKIVWQENKDKLKKYLSQLGVEDNDEDLLVADVGMYGAIHTALKDLYPQKKIKSLFLISASRDQDIEGYLFDANKNVKELDPLWKKIMGNPAVHFLEDTFSGFYGSTQGLEEKNNGKIKPTLGTPYSREVYLKRLAAVSGIVDHTLLKEDGKSASENSAALNEYLTTKFNEEKEHLMVPHE